MSVVVAYPCQNIFKMMTHLFICLVVSTAQHILDQLFTTQALATSLLPGDSSQPQVLSWEYPLSLWGSVCLYTNCTLESKHCIISVGSTGSAIASAYLVPDLPVYTAGSAVSFHLNKFNSPMEHFCLLLHWFVDLVSLKKDVECSFSRNLRWFSPGVDICPFYGQIKDLSGE